MDLKILGLMPKGIKKIRVNFR